jgi:hypothetical protein
MSEVFKAMEQIAKQMLEINTLTPRNSDSADFHEVHVIALRKALEAAYSRGKIDARLEASKATLDYRYDGD